MRQQFVLGLTLYCRRYQRTNLIPLQCMHLCTYACVTSGGDYDAKAFAGRYDLVYTSGVTDTTTVECDGNVKWRENSLNGKLHLAGSKLPADRAAQNNDPNYQAADGWFFRPWSRPTAWEFVRFPNGQMIVHQFCSDGICTGKSPEGSANFCCQSTGERKPTTCAGK